ncbi:MAG: nitroreductase family protein [Actinobacteria bacterium]|nr:nitroreductase family protein [Actinomycetota bacterium]
MQFAEVVRRRRMVRNYRDEPVAREVVERVVAAARRAPSAGFSQGQRFVVITDTSTRQAIAQLAGEDEYVASGFHPWISAAPVHVVVCTREASYHERYTEDDKLQDDGNEIDWPVPYWFIDAGGSMAMLLLAAVDAGLGAGVFGIHRLQGLSDLLGIPADVTPIGVVTLGYAAPDRPSGSLRRGWHPIEDVVHWERWAPQDPEARSTPSTSSP